MSGVEGDVRRRRLRRFVKQVMEQGQTEVLDEIWGAVDVGRKWGDDFEDMAAFKGWIDRRMGQFEELEFDIESILIDGRYGAVRCVARGVTAEEHYGIVPPGQEFDVCVTHHVQFDEQDRLVSTRTDFDFLEFLPESSRYARTSFVETVEDGVIVVADDGDVTDINEAALAAFRPETAREALLGEPVETVLPEGATLPDPGETAEIDGPGGIYEVTASLLEDNWDGEIGCVLVFRDVTERRRRVQQLQVLSRVLRHNIRNDLNVVLGRMESAAQATDDPTATAELAAAREQATDLLETAETARDVQRVLDQTARRRRDLVTVVESAVAQFRETWPDASVEVDAPARLPVSATDPLPDAIYELVENAWEHGDTDPRVTLRTDGDWAVVEVADDGPGFPERELVVIEEGEETQLKHGSGLGLWFTRWVVRASGGKLSVRCDDGATVTSRLPLADV
ncbi:MAG: ATP-binding protein [Halobaculum sp.]